MAKRRGLAKDAFEARSTGGRPSQSTFSRGRPIGATGVNYPESAIREGAMHALRNGLMVSSVVLLLAGEGIAQQVPMPPAEGKTSYTVYFTENVPRELDWGDLGSASITHLTGITRNKDGQAFFDQMATTCISHYVEVTAAGAPRLQGSCSYMDRDGDQIFSTFVPGKLTYVGGTGKYTGLSGEGSLKSGAFGGPASMTARISEVEMSWSIKR
jgi:hypothetical protein